MVVLNPVAVVGVDRPLHASRTMTEVTGVGFMPIQNRHIQSAPRGQRLVPFQTGVEVMQSLAQMLGIDAGVDAPHGIRTGRRATEPVLPEPRGAMLIERVQAAQAGPKHHQAGFEQNREGDARFQPRILHLGDDLLREAVDGLAIPDQTSEDETIPFDRGAAATQSPRVPQAVAGFPDSPEHFAGRDLPIPWVRTAGAACRPGSGPDTATSAAHPGRSGSWVCRIGESGEPKYPEEIADSTRAVRGGNGGYARRPTN